MFLFYKYYWLGNWPHILNILLKFCANVNGDFIGEFQKIYGRILGDFLSFFKVFGGF